jgi:nicotinate-nucleotide adenylyltransferase
MPRVEISSSLIRQYCGDRRSIRYLVPDAVLDYITAHNLYDAQAHNQCPHH